MSPVAEIAENIHRPGCLVPEDYELVTPFYCGSGDGARRVYAQAQAAYETAVNAPDASIFRGNWEEKGTCDSCGTKFIYGALMRHKSGELVHFGHVCVGNLIGISDDAERLKIRAERARKLPSDKQIKFLRALSKELGIKPDAAPVSMAEASTLIDEFLAERDRRREKLKEERAQKSWERLGFSTTFRERSVRRTPSRHESQIGQCPRGHFFRKDVTFGSCPACSHWKEERRRR